MNRRGMRREAQRVQINREELVERMARALPEDGAREALDGLFLGRVSKPMESVHALFQPTFCFIAQGGKRVVLGEEVKRRWGGQRRTFPLVPTKKRRRPAAP